MAYNDKNMVNDYNGHKIPQYYNPVTDKYEPLHGANNVSFVGNHVLSDSGIWLPVSATNPMHVKNNELENKIDNLEAKIDSIIESGAVNTRLTGSNVGYSNETKPIGKKGETFLELDTLDVYIHDGSGWVKI